ncbi:Smr/MutS family protein [Marilutibacter aestuarii]|uniref:SMR domain protein n=1 Tax=Marilutibacter aestuarii TaxID=1706195 RepID=A0A508A721_9GAMM|nr:Smr/MutS family protein [Lysobacter aestuarii]TQD45187.1 SMR domain protein [Lysobacter aestuarii]
MKRAPPPPGSTPDTDDDAALFRDAIGPVREIKAPAPVPSRPRPRPRARMAELDEIDAREAFRRGQDLPTLAAGDPLSYRRDALPPRAWQRLRRGEISPQEELDLHGTDARSAEALLRAFVTDAHRHGLGCVRVIHGKGLHGDGAPVLKNLVDRLLRHRSDVLGFHSAPAAQGGTGAVLVLLAPPGRR